MGGPFAHHFWGSAAYSAGRTPWLSRGYELRSMSMPPRHIWFRRPRRAVAIAQLLTFAGALLLQGLAHSIDTSSRTRAVQAADDSSPRAHNVVTCLSCTLLRNPARLPDAPRVPLFVDSGLVVKEQTADSAPQSHAEQSLFSRAPPRVTLAA